MHSRRQVWCSETTAPVHLIELFQFVWCSVAKLWVGAGMVTASPKNVFKKETENQKK